MKKGFILWYVATAVVFVAAVVVLALGYTLIGLLMLPPPITSATLILIDNLLFKKYNKQVKGENNGHKTESPKESKIE